MPRFPDKEADILALANQMMAGYLAHLTDFPSIKWPTFYHICKAYVTARNAQKEAYAAAQLATEEKNRRLQHLKEEMRCNLKKSEVDVSGDPVKLAYIGWGPKAAQQPIVPPGQPVNLTIISQGRDTLTLKWQRPTAGGPVRYYLIERRSKEQSGSFGQWQLVESCYDREKQLTNQPKGIELEYRMIAVNSSGQSPTSNIAFVVL